MTSRVTSAVGIRANVAQRSSPRDWLLLTKPGIVVSNVLMTAVGLSLAPRVTPELAAATLLGTALLIASCGALNMVLESETDARMERTRNRPVASQRITATAATMAGGAFFLLGSALLVIFANPTAAMLGMAASFIYVALYTPLKRSSRLAIPVGAVSGALPPVIGWFAGGGDAGLAPWLLFAVLFVWQIPHFLAISVRRWRDYQEAGLAIGSPPALFKQSVGVIRLTSFLLLGLGVATVLATSGGAAFLLLTVVASGGMLVAATRPASDTLPWSRTVFFSSLAYLPAFALGAFFSI